MQITSNIWQVGGDDFTTAQDAAAYLLSIDGRAAIVDAGCGGHGDRLAANIQACGIGPGQVDVLLLTHCHFDHAGGAADLRERLGCSVAAHELDAAALERGDSRLTAAHWYAAAMQPLAIDVTFTGSHDQIQLGSGLVDVIHVPGHTPGSVVYLVTSDGQRVLFGQDVHGPLHADFDSDAADYRRSLRRLIDLNADILCEGHFGVIRGAPAVQRFIRSYM